MFNRAIFLYVFRQAAPLFAPAGALSCQMKLYDVNCQKNSALTFQLSFLRVYMSGVCRLKEKIFNHFIVSTIKQKKINFKRL